MAPSDDLLTYLINDVTRSRTNTSSISLYFDVNAQCSSFDFVKYWPQVRMKNGGDFSIFSDQVVRRIFPCKLASTSSYRLTTTLEALFFALHCGCHHSSHGQLKAYFDTCSGGLSFAFNFQPSGHWDFTPPAFPLSQGLSKVWMQATCLWLMILRSFVKICYVL